MITNGIALPGGLAGGSTHEAELYLCPGALSDADNPVLVGVEDLPHLAHGLGVSGGGGEVTVQVQPPKEASPAVVPLGCVGQAPGHQRLTLPSQHQWFSLAAHAAPCLCTP